MAGTIPLEALRLGCESHALDLNPVAYLIELCTLVYPQQYGRPDPTTYGMTGPKNDQGKTTWGGLAEELRHWGNWVLKQVKTEIGDLYPLIPDPEFKGKRIPVQAGWFKESAPVEVPLGYLMPVGYLWSRTVTCKNPHCRAAVPLVKQTWLCKKPSRFVAMKTLAPKGRKCVRFEIVETRSEKALGFNAEIGSKGGNATCPFCGTVADSDYVKAEGCAERMATQLMAIACTRPGKPGKVYLAADDVPHAVPDDETIQHRIQKLCKESGLTVPNEDIVNDAKNASFCVLYGLSKFASLFSSRQMLSLLTCCESVRRAENEMKHTHNISDDRASALTTLLGICVSKLSDYSSGLCTFNYTGGRGVKNTFARQSLPMVWDYAETNPFNPDGASLPAVIEDIPAVLQNLGLLTHPAVVSRGSAMALPMPSASLDAVVTDPPYYDNVPYSNISDFFYVWLKRSVGHLHPEHFAGMGTPKRDEAVADATRHAGDRGQARIAYEGMMAKSLREAARVLKPGGHLTVVYAHKTTLGWATLVNAMREAGFLVLEAWPLDTEKPGRLRDQESAALASSIFLVARKRDGGEVGNYEEQVQPELEQIVRERVGTLWEMGISGADLVIACVGAGLRAFTRFARVEYANGEEVPAERFLTEVETVVLETILARLSREVGGNNSQRSLAGLDSPTRFYVLWRYTYKAADLDAGEAIIFANGTHVELDGAHGLSTGARALVAKNKTQVSSIRLRGARRRRHARHLPSEDGQPSTTDRRTSPYCCG